MSNNIRAVMFSAATVLFSLLSFQLHAGPEQPIEVGGKLTLNDFVDQFDTPYALQTTTRWLLLSHDMDSSKISKQALLNLEQSNLDQHNIQYFADISGMPGFISRFVAIPKLKDLKYAIGLGWDDEQLEHLPRQEDRVTLLQLEDGKVTQVQYFDDAKKLADALFNQPKK